MGKDNQSQNRARGFVARALKSGRAVRKPCLVCGLAPYDPLSFPRTMPPKGLRRDGDYCRSLVQFHHALGYAAENRGCGIWLCRSPEHGHRMADLDPEYNLALVEWAKAHGALEDIKPKKADLTVERAELHSSNHGYQKEL